MGLGYVPDMYNIYVVKPFNYAGLRFGVGKSQAHHVGAGSRILMPVIQESRDRGVPAFDSDHFIDPVTLQPYGTNRGWFDSMAPTDCATGEPIADLKDYIVVTEEGTDVCI